MINVVLLYTFTPDADLLDPYVCRIEIMFQTEVIRHKCLLFSLVLYGEEFYEVTERSRNLILDFKNGSLYTGIF